MVSRFSVLVSGCVLGVVACIVLAIGGFSTIERHVELLQFRNVSEPVSGQVVMVISDKETIQRVRASIVPADAHGRVLQILAAKGVKRVYLDHSLAENPDNLRDEELNRAFALYSPETLALPLPRYSRRSDLGDESARAQLHDTSAHVAFVDSSLYFSDDGRIRTIPASRAGLVSAVGWLVDWPEELRIDFGLPLHRIPVVRFHDVLDGRTTFDFQDKTVIMGYDETLVQLMAHVPYRGQLGRTHITALAAESVLSNRVVSPLFDTIGTYCAVFLVSLLSVFVFFSPIFYINAITCFSLMLTGLFLQILCDRAFLVSLPMGGVIGTLLMGLCAATVLRHPKCERIRASIRAYLARVDFRFAEVIEKTSDHVLTFDKKGQILSYNAAAGHFYHLKEGAMLDECLPEQSHKLISYLNRNRLMGLQKSLHMFFDLSDDHFELFCHAVETSYGWVGYLTLRQARSRDDELKALEDIAYKDALTGCANRLALLRHLDDVVHSLMQRGECAALLLLDLNGFKEVNDTLGHHAGDELLKGVVKRFQAILRQKDFLARLGGDEFVIVLTADTDVSNGIVVAEKIRAVLQEPFTLEAQNARVGSAIGISQFGPDCYDVEEVLSQADSAMYQAKTTSKTGGPWYHVHTPEGDDEPFAEAS